MSLAPATMSHSHPGENGQDHFIEILSDPLQLKAAREIYSVLKDRRMTHVSPRSLSLMVQSTIRASIIDITNFDIHNPDHLAHLVDEHSRQLDIHSPVEED